MQIDSQCINCDHWTNHEKKNKCKAFPQGIPKKILLNKHDHKKPYPGDGGIRFKPKKKKKEAS